MLIKILIAKCWSKLEVFFKNGQDLITRRKSLRGICWLCASFEKNWVKSLCFTETECFNRQLPLKRAKFILGDRRPSARLSGIPFFVFRI